LEVLKWKPDNLFDGFKVIRRSLSVPTSMLWRLDFIGGPDRTRTCDLRFRKPLLYPAELRDQVLDNFEKFDLGRFCKYGCLLPFCYPIVFARRRWSSASLSARSTLFAAASCMPGNTWLYRLSVVLMSSWPSRSWTILGCTLLLSSWVA
jgi:hypothetical protein